MHPGGAAHSRASIELEILSLAHTKTPSARIVERLGRCNVYERDPLRFAPGLVPIDEAIGAQFQTTLLLFSLADAKETTMPCHLLLLSSRNQLAP
eukprot:scaffold176966_cov26-Tisochrysis_lutea.AAC.3